MTRLDTFKKGVDAGLSAIQKTLPSKYFYDARGDELFVQIMNMPEYYLTDAEMEIFQGQTMGLITDLGLKKNSYFELVELGAGDGAKTKKLLEVLVAEGYQFDYLPVDISGHALRVLAADLATEIPKLNVETRQGEYFEILAGLHKSEQPKVVLFLGSSLGNMDDKLAAKFLYKLGASLRKNDKLLLGTDLVKPAEIVLPAYDDAAGITREFNLNLLRRINRELDADFDLENFEHSPEYDAQRGIATSFLKSKKEQSVSIGALNKSFSFETGEQIKTEISRKYSDEILREIIRETDFLITGKRTDSRGYFADFILTRN
ncbi:MAG: L-histidine N(alpha)-methyltransferase [Chitinophagaceae bacterium]